MGVNKSIKFMLLCGDGKQNFVSKHFACEIFACLISFAHLFLSLGFCFNFRMQLKLLFRCLFWVNFQWTCCCDDRCNLFLVCADNCWIWGVL